MLRKLISIIVFCVAASALGHAQQIDPSWQVAWSTPITGQGPQSEFYNNIPQADQFPGTDMCQKVWNAAVYAIANHLPTVDATHFSGLQTCTSGVNPFAGWTGVTDYTPVNLSIKFGSVHMQSSVMLELKNSALDIEGVSPTATILEYDGAGTPVAAMYGHAQASGVTNGIEQVTLRNFFVLGGNNTNTDALLLQDVNRSEVSNVAAWGANSSSGNAIHLEGCVTTTVYRDKTSGREYAMIANLISGTHTTPSVGFNFDASSASGYQTTDGTVTDFAAEYLTTGTGIGMVLTSANSMTVTSGTSEANKAGILVDPASSYNTFISTDEEGNSVYDVQDGGKSNHWVSPIATNASFASTAQWNTWDSGFIQVGNFTNNAPSSNGNRIINQGNMLETPLVWAQNLTSGPTSMPFSGTSHLWGGIGGMNAQLSGGELDIFTAYTASAQTACFYHNTGSGYVVDNCLGLSSFFNGTNLFNGAVTTNSSLTINGSIITTYGGAGITYTPGTGVTSVACVGGHTCNNIRGQIAITNSTATTTETLATINFGSSPLSSIPECSVVQQSGTAWYGLYGTATTSHLTITNNNTVSGVTSLFVAYECIQ